MYTTKYVTYTGKIIPVKPTWSDAKQQVFSSSSTISRIGDDDSDIRVAGNDKTEFKIGPGLWEAAADAVGNSSVSELWAEAVDPSEYED